MHWIWPLQTLPRIPVSNEPGAFGAVRKHDVHTGVDLYTPEGANERVYAVEAGEVIFVGPFTGPEAGSDWWLATACVAVRGEHWTVLYGEVTTELQAGQQLKQGDLIGRVTRVLRHDKGLPTTMLHLELYKTFEAPVEWLIGKPKPSCLMDPTELLILARTTTARRRL